MLFLMINIFENIPVWKTEERFQDFPKVDDTNTHRDRKPCIFLFYPGPPPRLLQGNRRKSIEFANKMGVNLRL